MTLRFQDLSPQGGAPDEALQEFSTEIKEKSGGKIEIDPYYAGSLVPATEVVTGVGNGVVDLADGVVHFNPQELPISNWMLDAGSTATTAFPSGLLSQSGALIDTYLGSEEVRAEFERKGLKLLNVFSPSEPPVLFCRKPVTSLADAKGLRVRTAGDTWAEEVKALGMVPTTLTINELYEGLQRGVADCTTGEAATFAVEMKIMAVAPYATPLPFSRLPGEYLVMNLKEWKSLPSDAQQVISDAALTHAMAYQEGLAKLYGEVVSSGTEDGGEFLKPEDELVTALTEHQQERVASMVDRAPEGLSDPQGFLDSFLERQDHWLAVAGELGFPTEAPAKSFEETYARAETIDTSGFLQKLLVYVNKRDASE